MMMMMIIMIKRVSWIWKYAQYWFARRQFHILGNNARLIWNSLIILIAL